MNFRYSYVICLAICLLITHILGCLYSQTKNQKSEFRKRLNDPEYVLQKFQMNLCQKSLTESEEISMIFLKNYIIYHAYNEVNQKLSIEDSIRFRTRGLIKCFEFVADHKAYKMVCDDFRNQYMDYDLLELEAILEYENCVAEKNYPYIREVIFEIPEILKDDITILSDYILNL